MAEKEGQLKENINYENINKYDNDLYKIVNSILNSKIVDKHFAMDLFEVSMRIYR